MISICDLCLRCFKFYQCWVWLAIIKATLKLNFRGFSTFDYHTPFVHRHFWYTRSRRETKSLRLWEWEWETTVTTLRQSSSVTRRVASKRDSLAISCLLPAGKKLGHLPKENSVTRCCDLSQKLRFLTPFCDLILACCDRSQNREMLRFLTIRNSYVVKNEINSNYFLNKIIFKNSKSQLPLKRAKMQ